MHTHIINFQ